MEPKVLIVDDDAAICGLLKMMLDEEGIPAIDAQSVASALRVIDSEDICLAIIDLRLGGEDGLELVRQVSALKTIGIIIVSGKADPIDRVIGLEVGADDYITKPFHSRELIARVKRQIARSRQLREHAGEPDDVAPLKLGTWIIDTQRHSVVSECGAMAPLSDAELRTLVHLLKNRGKVLTRDELHRQVVGPVERGPLDRRIDVHVRSIRKKLGLNGDGIRTVHRVGYIVD